MAKKAAAVDLVQDDEDIDSIISFSEDITDAEAPEPLPEREYPATIVEVTRQDSKAGDPMAVVKWKISEDDYPADYDAGNAPGGKTLTQYVLMQDTPAGRHRSRRYCEAIGAPTSKRLDVKSWVGLNATVTVKHEEYEGVNRERISKVDAA